MRSLSELDLEVERLRGLALEESTKRSYSTYEKSYWSFCTQYGLQPIPADQFQASRYAAFLALRLHPNSIPKYLGVIRSLHLEQGLPDPHILQSHRVKQVLTGINKSRGTATRRMEPITPAILLNLQKTLDLSTLGDSSFWCA